MTTLMSETSPKLSDRLFHLKASLGRRRQITNHVKQEEYIIDSRNNKKETAPSAIA